MGRKQQKKKTASSGRKKPPSRPPVPAAKHSCEPQLSEKIMPEHLRFASVKECEGVLSKKRETEAPTKTKSVEERRKEIALRFVAASMLLKLGSPSVQEKGLIEKKKEWVQSLWNSMSVDSKKDLLNIRVSDLTANMGLQQGQGQGSLANEVLLDALTFFELNETWKFWICCLCADKKFADSFSHMEHFAEEHFVHVLTQEMDKVVPGRDSKEWTEILNSCSWNPLDLSDAIDLIENESKMSENYQLDYSNVRKVDDITLAAYLKRIKAYFVLLNAHESLAESHVTTAIEMTKRDLQSLVSGSGSDQLLNHGVYKNPMCICFLGEAKLIEIFKFLRDLCRCFGLNKYSDKTASLDDMNSPSQNPETKGKIVLKGDALCLILDESLLSDGAIEDATLTNANGLLSWIFSGASSWDQFASWIHMKEDKTLQGLDTYQKLMEEFNYMETECKKKCECISSKEALQTVEDLCLEEDGKRGTASELARRSYESVLKERLDELELAECGNDGMSVSSTCESNTISNVLQVAVDMLNSYQADDALKTNEMDNFIKTAIHSAKYKSLTEESSHDTKIINHLSAMKQLKLKYVHVCAQDYESIMLPFARSYLKVQLEDLAEKHVTKKSDDAAEALLAELACESSNSQEKRKDKKKNKKFDKPMDSKASGANKPQMLKDDKISSTIAPDSNSEETRYDDCESRESAEESSVDHQSSASSLKDQSQEEVVPGKTDLGFKTKDGLRTQELNETRMFDTGQQNEATFLQFGSLCSVAEKTSCVSRESDEESSVDHHNSASSLKDQSQEEVVPGKTDLGFKTKDGLPTQELNETRMFDTGLQNNATVLQFGSLYSVAEKTSCVSRESPEESSVDHHSSAISLKDHSQDAVLPAKTDLGFRTKDGLLSQDLNETCTVGIGLKNEGAENNCFLNVIIQSMWHLRRFRDELLSRLTSEHFHARDRCVFCAFCDIFSALKDASTEARKEPVSPTPLRIAMSNLYAERKQFQQGQMDDASEVLPAILGRLHRAFTSRPSVSDALVSSDCSNSAYILHSLFGMNISFHHINVYELQNRKISSPQSSFPELLQFEETDGVCEACGELNNIHFSLSNSPHVFIIAIYLGKTRESDDVIADTLNALNTEINLTVLCNAFEPQNSHKLVAVVCYRTYHFICIIYNRNRKRWIKYDDSKVEAIGGWEDVVKVCIEEHWQPNVVLFEAVN